MAEPVVSARSYVLTYFALLVLTLGTTLVAFFDRGWVNMLVGLLFAVAKATLIASIFMHALFESKLVKLVIVGALIWFLIMVSGIVGDYVTRGWFGFGGR